MNISLATLPTAFDNGTMLTNPWELAWDEVTASDILTLDESGALSFRRRVERDTGPRAARAIA